MILYLQTSPKKGRYVPFYSCMSFLDKLVSQIQFYHLLDSIQK